jgi:hypothetical protein
MDARKAVRIQLDEKWASRSVKTDWLGFESFLEDILCNPVLSDTEKVQITREALDAWTRRGHLNPDNYFPTIPEGDAGAALDYNHAQYVADSKKSNS